VKRGVLVLIIVAVAAGLSVMTWVTLTANTDSPAPSGPPAVSSDVPVELTDANFAPMTASGVVLVDFWAAWCPACTMQGPTVERLAGQFAGRALVGKLNVDANRATAAKFGISAIPTLIIFRDGRKVRQLVGVQSEAGLAAALQKALGS
jgi:thioredoxin 1